MSIIDKTYYSKDILLTEPQLKGLFDTWQEEYEEEILKKLLGYELYALYEADLASVTAGDPTDDRFKELVDGAEFSFELNGNTVNTKWRGLRNTAKLKSLVSYYAYYNYRNETESFNSGSGQKISSTENSTTADLRPKLISTWNKMIDWYGLTPYNLINIEYFLDNGNYCHYNVLSSAYNFLLANLETYPEWVFEPLDTQNIWGI